MLSLPAHFIHIKKLLVYVLIEHFTDCQMLVYLIPTLTSRKTSCTSRNCNLVIRYSILWHIQPYVKHDVSIGGERTRTCTVTDPHTDVISYSFATAEMVEVHSGVGTLNDDVKQMRSEMGTIKESLMERFNSLKYRSNGLSSPLSRPAGNGNRRQTGKRSHVELHV